MTLKVLTIGAGYFAALHVEAWMRNPDTSLIGLVDRDPHKAQALTKNAAPGTPSFQDAQTAMDATKPDIIDIATPPDTHAELIALADRARPKAIICQKPFCGTLQNAQETVKATQSLLIVHENFRFQPWYRALKSELAKATIGRPYQLTFRLRTGDGQGPDAYLARQPYFQKMDRFLIHETGIHYIDTFRYLMGEPTGVFADLRRLNPTIRGEDSGLVIFQFDDDRRAVFDGNRLADHRADNRRLTMGEATLEGAKGTLDLDGYGRVFLRRTGETAKTQLEFDLNATVFGGDCVYAFQKHVTDHLTKGAQIETRAEDYLRNMEIEEAIYASAKAGRVMRL